MRSSCGPRGLLLVVPITGAYVRRGSIAPVQLLPEILMETPGHNLAHPDRGHLAVVLEHDRVVVPLGLSTLVASIGLMALYHPSSLRIHCQSHKAIPRNRTQ